MDCIYIFLVVLLFSTALTSSSQDGGQLKSDEISKNDSKTGNERYHVAVIDFSHVSDPFIIALWVLLASIAKIGFHLYNKLSSIFPESCLLIVLGILVGVILYFTNVINSDYYYLNSTTFFLFLLPPIVLEAGYFLPSRAFFDNIGTILIYAVIGTLFNTLMIGVSLWLVGGEVLGWMDRPVSLLTCLVFSSLISAVDPVAVLAVFEQIHVNEVLFIIVFGESLLNDAVTVVLYHMFDSFNEINQHGTLLVVDYVAGVASFLVVSLGGIVIGLLFGALTSFITKYTEHVRVIEPVFVFVMSYLAYLTAEIFHLSGILSIVFCGVFMKNYVTANISQKSSVTVKYFLKMLSSVSETIIFMFLGLSTVTDQHHFHLGFVSFTLVFCFIYRILGVILLTWVANRFRLVKLTSVDQFVMAYGGLRGAIAFSLVSLLSEDLIPEKRMLVTTTIVVIYFTVFIQGISIKPLVNVLRVKRKDEHDVTMNERIHTRLMDHCMSGMEDITGYYGHHRLRDSFDTINSKYLERVLLRDRPCSHDKTAILHTLSKLNMKDALTYISRNGSFLPHMLDQQQASLSTMTSPHGGVPFMEVERLLFIFLLQSQLGPTLQPYDVTGPVSRFDEVTGPPSRFDDVAGPSADTVLDLHSLNVDSSDKMLDDSKFHHMVELNMFRPRQKWAAPARHRVDEEVNQPHFHHQLRHQIRHMVSKRSHDLGHQTIGREVKKGAPSGEEKQTVDGDGGKVEESRACINVMEANAQPPGEVVGVDSGTTRRTSGREVNQIELDGGATTKTSGCERSPIDLVSSDSESDDGITFTARTQPDTDKCLVVAPPQPTVAESSLPWKRAYIQPAMPSLSHTVDVSPDDVNLSDCPSWAAHLDYKPDYTQTTVFITKHEVESKAEFSIPPPWRMSEESIQGRTDNDSALPISHITADSDQLDTDQVDTANAAASAVVDKKTVEKPTSLPWHRNHDNAICESVLPWRSPPVTNGVEPMISPSASQIWTQHLLQSQTRENGTSHHSDPISGHHHVTSIHNDLTDYHGLLADTFQHRIHMDNLMLNHEDINEEEDANLLKLELQRRHPSFQRIKSHMLERRPSVNLPLELNREEDCRARIHKWLQSSHPDSLACPPDFTQDLLPLTDTRPACSNGSHHIDTDTSI